MLSLQPPGATESDLILGESLLALARWLEREGYRFTTVTPATHARVNARPGAQVARTLHDVFGWSRAFPAALLPDEALEWLRAGGLLRQADAGLLRSAVRFSSIDDTLFAHSAYPTTDEDAVFFGPDTYRFVQLVQQVLRDEPLPAGGRILEMCCGGGPGGIMAARANAGRQPRLALADINPRALQFAAANAAQAGLDGVELAQGDLYAAVQGPFDLVVANPPYLVDRGQRTYRHGGGRWGEALSARIVREGVRTLAPGGRLVLYTGVAIVDGADPLLQDLQGFLDQRGWPWHYRELDPDVFGEELDEPAYADAQRIAAVALVVQRPQEDWPADPMAVHLHPAMA